MKLPLPIHNAIFIMMVLVTVVSACLTVSARNIFHAALWLALCFTGVAGIYILLNAEFLFAVQLLIYVGAIAVLILFAVMLSRQVTRERRPRKFHWQRTQLGSFALAGGLFFLGLYCLLPLVERLGDPIVPAGLDATAEIGKSFLSYQLLPFEIASVVLLVALVGAVFLAKPEETE